MHILVVEDEQRLAFLLRRVLLEERHTVDLAHDGHSGLDLALSDTYDVVVLDVMLPGIDGLEICRQMRAERIMSPVLMLTARGSVEDRVTGLNVGADDYLTKPFAMEELLARINALLRRRDHRFDENPRLCVGDLTLDLVGHQARRGGRIIELTAKEFALLEYLMRHPGRVLTRTQIVKDKHALLEVSDTGIGIAAEHLPHLGERFYRVDKARSREAGGTGLGLSIARSIAVVHEGSLTLTSIPDQGTTVTLELPLAQGTRSDWEGDERVEIIPLPEKTL